MSGVGQYRGSRRYTHTSIRQKSALGVRRSCTLCVSPTSAAASEPPPSAPRVSSSSSSASPCSPKQPLPERAPTVAQRRSIGYTSANPYAKCSLRRAAGLRRPHSGSTHGRTCTPAQAPVPQDARPAQHVATQYNMLQHAATQRNVCALHQRRSRCRRMRGLCGAFDTARPRRLACANPTDSASASNVHAAAPALYCRADVRVHVRVRRCEEMRVCACPRAVAGGEGVARHGGGGWRRARTGADVDKQKQVRARLLVELLRRVHEHVVAPHLCRAESQSDTARAYRGVRSSAYSGRGLR